VLVEATGLLIQAWLAQLLQLKAHPHM
jgi:hypothetical protein